MMHLVYTIYDSKAEAYLQPFYTQNDGTAIRAFSELCNDPDHQFSRHPEDFTLFFCGTFNDANATFTCPATPTPIGKAIEFKRQVEMFPHRSIEGPELFGPLKKSEAK